MKKVKLHIAALGNSESHPGNYILMLEEHRGERRLPIVVGAFEAQAIAIALERMQPQRPLTHDLFKNALEQLNFIVEEVMISDLTDGVYHAKILGTDTHGRHQEIDARSSDAIALALRFSCPIYTTESILQEVGVKTTKQKRLQTNLESYSTNELESLLQQKLEKEEYEEAAKLRDILERKRNEAS